MTPEVPSSGGRVGGSGLGSSQGVFHCSVCVQVGKGGGTVVGVGEQEKAAVSKRVDLKSSCHERKIFVTMVLGVDQTSHGGSHFATYQY